MIRNLRVLGSNLSTRNDFLLCYFNLSDGPRSLKMQSSMPYTVWSLALWKTLSAIMHICFETSMLGVLINFDELDSQFFQKII